MSAREHPEFPAVELLVLQPTPFCNINCSYCYLPGRQKRDRMDLGTLRNTILWLKSAGALGETLSVVWHAGEPLVLPVSYYRDAVSVIEAELPDKVELRQSFQTNATLITEEWCDFIEEQGISVGVSIDGPAFINDRNRRTRSGKGTFDQAMEGLERLKVRGIDFHVIAVLTAESLEFPDELFDFFVENEVRRVGFNVEEIEAVNTTSSLQGSGIEARYRSFMKRLLRLVKRSGDAIKVREFVHLKAWLLAPPGSALTNPQTTPFSIISVDCHGNLSTFSPELLGTSGGGYASFSFGNVNRDSPEAVLTNPNFVEVASDIASGLDLCRQSCDYFEVCGGGAPSNKLFETGTFATSETLYCRLAKQALIDIVLSDLEAAVGTQGT